jgi:hypothetical protein
MSFMCTVDDSTLTAIFYNRVFFEESPRRFRDIKKQKIEQSRVAVLMNADDRVTTAVL